MARPSFRAQARADPFHATLHLSVMASFRLIAGGASSPYAASGFLADRSPGDEPRLSAWFAVRFPSGWRPNFSSSSKGGSRGEPFRCRCPDRRGGRGGLAGRHRGRRGGPVPHHRARFESPADAQPYGCGGGRLGGRDPGGRHARQPLQRHRSRRRLAVRAGRGRILRQPQHGGDDPARALGLPLEPQARRQHQRARLRRHEDRADLVRRRPQRLPYPSHAVPDLDQISLDQAVRRIFLPSTCSSTTAASRARPCSRPRPASSPPSPPAP